MTEELRKVGKTALFGDGPSPEEARVFGRMLFTYGWRISAFAFALWALGAFASFGLGGGFAYSDPTKLMQANVDARLSAIERRQLEQDILATFKEGCASPSKDYFRMRLSELQIDYAKRTSGPPYPLPTCEALGIRPNGD